MVEHVRNQNWFAVGLDFLIVVIGVFIGIQVANWNAARQVAANDAALMLRLQAELETIETGLLDPIERNNQTIGANRRILEYIRSGEPPEDEAGFKDDLCVSSFLVHAPARATAIGEMNGSGALTRIQSPELRGAIAAYAQAHARYESMMAETHSSMTNPLGNFYLAVEPSTDPEIWMRGVPGCIERYDFEQLRASRGELILWLGGQLDLDYYANTQLEEVRQILAYLQEGHE